MQKRQSKSIKGTQKRHRRCQKIEKGRRDISERGITRKIHSKKTVWMVGQEV